MGVHLIFLFLFQGGLAFAFTYFIARILLGGSEGEGRKRMIGGMRKIRLIVFAMAVILTPSMFFAYYKSLPEGQPVSLAVWPAVWILVILLAVILALQIALHRQRNNA
ncbi:MAG TPA: hypothetical protein VK995_06460 [Oceanipulchritudo sp.]|nr:hypothetical protein [Oceanipulchritudo sp.]